MENSKIPLLNNVHIMKKYGNNTRFGGWFARDDLPTKIQNKFYIINQDDKKGQGSHWVMVYNCRPSVCLYFDPFGLDPAEEVLKFMKSSGKQCAMSDNQIQDINSMMCGWYCMYVIDELERGKKFIDITFKDFDIKKIPLNESKIKKAFYEKYKPEVEEKAIREFQKNIFKI